MYDEQEMKEKLEAIVKECPSCCPLGKLTDLAASLGRQRFKAGDWAFVLGFTYPRIMAEDGFVGDACLFVIDASWGRPRLATRPHEVTRLATKSEVDAELSGVDAHRVKCMADRIVKDFLNDNK